MPIVQQFHGVPIEISSCWFFKSKHHYGEYERHQARLVADLKTCLAAKFVRVRRCAAAFSLQVPKSDTDLDLTFLYIFMLGTHTKLVTSAGRRFATSRSRFEYYQTIGSFPQK